MHYHSNPSVDWYRHLKEKTIHCIGTDYNNNHSLIMADAQKISQLVETTLYQAGSI